jgi:hypothetical protein
MSELFARVSAILQEQTSSEAVSALIGEVEAQRATLNAEAGELRQRAADPLISGADAVEANERRRLAELEEKRCASALELLRKRLRDVEAGEKAASDAVAYAAAQEERDALVSDLCKIYPKAAACSAKIAAVNKSLPAGAPVLEFPEFVARGVRQHEEGNLLAHAVRLPAFDSKDIFFNPIWPPK